MGRKEVRSKSGLSIKKNLPPKNTILGAISTRTTNFIVTQKMPIAKPRMAAEIARLIRAMTCLRLPWKAQALLLLPQNSQLGMVLVP